MLLNINPQNPEPRKIRKVVECLQDGGIIIYPTDTLYGLGCDIMHKKAVEKLCRLKGLDPQKAHLTCVCEDVKILGEYGHQISTPIYKIIKQAFPGPYTFILQASKKIPKHFQTKSTVGIRVVDHPIPLEIVKHLGNPIASISLMAPENGEDWAYLTDPEKIHERYGKQVDIVIDGGTGNLDASTVIDCSKGEDAITVIRQGAGSLERLGIELQD